MTATIRTIPHEFDLDEFSQQMREALGKACSELGIPFTGARVVLSTPDPERALVEVKLKGFDSSVGTSLAEIRKTPEAMQFFAGMVAQDAKSKGAAKLQRNVPPLIKVRSQSIEEIGHDGDNLYVRFKHGHLYKYAGVGQAAYNQLRKAESVGKHLQIHIMRHHTGIVVTEKQEQQEKHEKE